MSHFIICLTIDIDPDGLSGVVTDRNSSSFASFEKLNSFPEIISDKLKRQAPVTWFVRIDDQVKYFFGSRLHLVETYRAFWDKTRAMKHEIAWHPHIYQQSGGEFVIPQDAAFACDQVSSVHEEISGYQLELKSFRNGEGWQRNETIELVEQLGYTVDSTAIPGIMKPAPHLLNWKDTPNHPYYPSVDNYRVNASERKLLEIPMNTWIVKAPYDKEPRLRYMNPCIHANIFEESLLSSSLFEGDETVKVLTFISHPDELVEQSTPDQLYMRTTENYIRNVERLTEEISRKNGTFEFCTLQKAAAIWKSNRTVNGN